MIVVAEDSRLLLITQPDHAHFAAELLSLWRSDSLATHPRRLELLHAVREHDNGWREADAAPRTDPSTGLPHDFVDFPDEFRLAVWTRGVKRFADSDPYASLLIAEHMTALVPPHSEPWRELFGQIDAWREGWLESAGVSLNEVREDYRFLQLADTLSLAVCCRRAGAFAVASATAKVETGTLLLDPFPLAGTTTLRIPCRHIPSRRYHGDADLGGTLAAATWEDQVIRVAPA